MSFFASKYVKFITGMPIHDSTAGFKCYKREVLETINFTIDWYKNFFKKENMKEFTLHQIEIFEKKIKRKYD